MNPSKQIFFVFGISRSGRASAEYLLKRKAKVFVYDDVQGEEIEKNISELEKKGAVRVAREDLLSMCEKCDALVLSPGIPIDHPVPVSFRRAKKGVIGETELAVRAMRCKIVAITGTNGKTTTVSMVGKILTDAGLNAKTCGNIGEPMIRFCDLDEESIAVAEISSFQLETLSSICPHVAIVLNITEDHLNRHYNMDNYVFLKRKLLKNQTETEYAVLNYDDERVRLFAENGKQKRLFVSVKERVDGAYLENGNLYFQGEKILPVSGLLLDGIHNVYNALCAICAAKIMGVRNETIRSSLESFKGVKHRVEDIGVVDGVRYIDDSKGTNVDATIMAVKCMKQETVLLLGGKDKGYEYDKLFTALKDSLVKTVVLYGENRLKLMESALRTNYKNVCLCPNFRFALKTAKDLATRGQTVLLSPASASFDEFESYEERGDAFVSFVLDKEKKREETFSAPTHDGNGGGTQIVVAPMAGTVERAQHVAFDGENGAIDGAREKGSGTETGADE